MAYTRGNSAQIIVGAAALFTHKSGPLTGSTTAPAFEATKSYKDTVTAASNWTNVGYTSTGLELMFTPNFGEVTVDQILDTARLYKQGMKVELKTSFAEATLENLLFSIAGKASQLTDDKKELTIAAGDIGEVPVEAGLIAVGPGTGDATASANTERVYVAYRVLSIQNVSVAAKRDAATEFAVTFRLLPDDNANYGKIVDRTWTITTS
jgi:hypothetical protein